MEQQMKKTEPLAEPLEWWIEENPELKRIFKRLVKQHKADLSLGETIRYIVTKNDEIE